MKNKLLKQKNSSCLEPKRAQNRVKSTENVTLKVTNFVAGCESLSVTFEMRLITVGNGKAAEGL